MNKRIFCFVVLLGLAIATEEFQTNDQLDIQFLQQSYLGKAILQMVELKTMSQGFDFSGLFVALDELKTSIDDRKADESKEFAEAHNQYLSDA
jgi:hypothetical protein